MKTIILYHCSDLDGHASGALAAIKAKNSGDEFELIGIDYGDPLPRNKLKGNNVIMVDFSLQPWSEMQWLAREASQFHWIDHHKSAIEEYQKNGLPGIHFTKNQIGKAACELCMEYFFAQSEPIPEFIRLLGRYDVWDHSDKRTLPFQMGMRLLNTDPATNLDWWESAINSESMSKGQNRGLFGEISRNGRTILEYQRQCNERLMGNAFLVEWKELRFLAVNASGINSKAFDSKWDPLQYDAVMSFYFSGNHWTVSLYSPDNSVDLSPIAKSMDGGGHASACGFQVDDIRKVINI